MKNIILITVVTFVLVSCVYNKDALPKPDGEGDSGGGSTAPTITYTSHAEAIIGSHCTSCHSAAGSGTSPFLNTYSAAFAKRVRIEARAIIQGTMPVSGPLPQTTKDTLQMWIDQGALQ